MITKKANECIGLRPSGSWPETVHEFEEKSIHAVNAALTAERPLLVRGEPGSGKSQLARAAAQVLNRAFIAEVVHARSDSRDLQWHFDAVSRLAEAQTLGQARVQEQAQVSISTRLDPRRFLSPGPLWWTFDWEWAESQYQVCRLGMTPPVKPDGWEPANGCVLLIDEIDKAEADLPNGLLETLGNGAFMVPYLDKPVGVKPGTPPPLVVITTNEERELPAAFLRRCLVLHLGLPEEEEALKACLCRRGEIHFGSLCDLDIRKKAADMLWQDRSEARAHGLPAPGQAEYLDLLRAVTRLGKSRDEQMKSLQAIAEFALVKHLEGR